MYPFCTNIYKKESCSCPRNVEERTKTLVDENYSRTPVRYQDIYMLAYVSFFFFFFFSVSHFVSFHSPFFRFVSLFISSFFYRFFFSFLFFYVFLETIASVWFLFDGHHLFHQQNEKPKGPLT